MATDKLIPQICGCKCCVSDKRHNIIMSPKTLGLEVRGDTNGKRGKKKPSSFGKFSRPKKAKRMVNTDTLVDSHTRKSIRHREGEDI